MMDEKVMETYIDHIKKYVSQTGGLFPHVTVFANSIEKEEEKETNLSIIHIPIPDEFMSDSGKDTFVDEVMPEVYKEIKKKFVPFGIAWASEAWLREADPNFDVTKENWKKLPIRKEVVFITIEDENLCKTQVYELKRVGKQVSGDGDLVDKVELEILQDLVNPIKTEGRFSGLYKKLNKDV